MSDGAIKLDYSFEDMMAGADWLPENNQRFAMRCDAREIQKATEDCRDRAMALFNKHHGSEGPNCLVSASKVHDGAVVVVAMAYRVA